MMMIDWTAGTTPIGFQKPSKAVGANPANLLRFKINILNMMKGML
jgi:hypothetical protein